MVMPVPDAPYRPERSGSGTARPILVTGAPRSGSTWLGNIIALAPGAGYVDEPFHRDCPAGRCAAGFPDYFTYVTRATEAPYVAALRDTLQWKYNLAAELRTLRSSRQAARMARDFAYFSAMRLRGARCVLKDPIAVFSAAWLADRFGAQVLVNIRHPAAFVASLRAAGWGRVHFETFGNQPALMTERLASFADQIAAATRRMPDPIAGGSLLWNIIHAHIHRLREEHPDWIFVRHEDLSREPVEGFHAAYERLGLDFTGNVRRNLERYTSGAGALAKISIFGTRRRTVRNSRDNIFAFRKRLTPEEIARVRTLTAPVAAHFYTDADW